MTYFNIADTFGHMYFVKRPEILKEVYEELKKVTEDLKSQLSEEILLIIVSDHGMVDSGDGVTGRHSCTAFYSLSKNIGWVPKTIYDFYPKIIELIS